MIALILGIGIGYFTLGPSVFIGGPTKAAIVQVTRAMMILSASSPAEDEAAKAAKITPQGLCSRNTDGSHACMVEISVEGAAPQALIVALKKDASGTWVPAQ